MLHFNDILSDKLKIYMVMYIECFFSHFLILDKVIWIVSR